MINKQLFIRCINSLQYVNDFQTGVNELIRNHNKQNINGDYCDLGAVMYPDCTSALLSLLEEVMGDTSGDISYFCYELDFGRDWHEGCITNEDGTDIKMATVDDLWDYLTSKGA